MTRGSSAASGTRLNGSHSSSSPARSLQSLTQKARRDRGSLRSSIPFLDITKKDIETSVRINIVSATAFSQAAVRAFIAQCVSTILPLPSPQPLHQRRKQCSDLLPANSGSEDEKGGTLIMTGATSALRGKETFGAFAAGKHGLRALSQVRTCPPSGALLALGVCHSDDPCPRYSRSRESTTLKEFTSLSS